MKPNERYLAVFSDTERKKLDRVPSFVQYVKPEFIADHEDELMGTYEGELFYNLRFDAPMVLGFDAVFADIPHSASVSTVELKDKQGNFHVVGLNGQVNKAGSSFYNNGLLYSLENLNALHSELKIHDASSELKQTMSFYETVSNRIFPVPAISGMFDTVWMAMSMNDFAINYRKKTKLYEEIIKFYAEITRANVEGIINALGNRPKVINILDDVAFKGRSMISPERWEQDLGKYYKEICKMIRDAGMIAQIHTDGDVTDLIPKFRAAGFQGLQGWEGGMNPMAVNKNFPDFVVIGFGDVSEILPFGTPTQVDAHVKSLMDALKSNRHYVVGPSTVIVKEMPYQNVLAFMNAIKKYGSY